MNCNYVLSRAPVSFASLRIDIFGSRARKRDREGERGGGALIDHSRPRLVRKQIQFPGFIDCFRIHDVYVSL